ncbi:helix-turn-helix domain-containing protein [Roseibium sp. FZY0029]|uniref:winged helix-turn-helix transcriptional regulator n=1 Tax=Roseibium sp. FZY0029 TaxID=3116647 RepID=UPI002EB40D65|nr:helix-turn-helix domain-containing protein [Roseibium sp. FZY0029]
MTKETKTTTRLRYDEGCLAAHALNLIGDRWALLVVRELMFSAKRFQMIRAGLPGITASVLTGRLAQLVEVDVVDHDERLAVYSLTEAGHALLPVLEALCRWALLVPGHDPTRFISPSALMISMGVNVVPEAATQKDALAGFDFKGEAFEMQLISGRVQTKAVSRADAPFVLSANGNQMAAAIYGSVPLADLIAKGMVEVSGDASLAAEFVSRFKLQRKT